MPQPKECIFSEKRVRKLKKMFFYLMTTFYNFSVVIETSSAKTVVNLISETRNVSVIV